jgi:hypothetical protein
MYILSRAQNEARWLCIHTTKLINIKCILLIQWNHNLLNKNMKYKTNTYSQTLYDMSVLSRAKYKATWPYIHTTKIINIKSNLLIQ